tara:strand:+ start:66 stop:578 length:513 start_codon:yes stop_codon:yes gene_type:complete
MPIGTTNISISSINTENTSTTSNSLKTLSETAVEGLSTLNEAPYAMSEFQNYAHTYSSTFTGYSTNSGGKADITRHRTTLANSTAVMSDGTFTLTLESERGGANGIRIIWGGGSAVSTGWTSVTIAQSNASTFTINRSAMTAGLEVGVYTHRTSSNNLTGSGTGSITFNS